MKISELPKNPESSSEAVTPACARHTLVTRQMFSGNALSDQLTEINTSFSRVTEPGGGVKHYHCNECTHSTYAAIKTFTSLNLRAQKQVEKGPVRSARVSLKLKEEGRPSLLLVSLRWPITGLIGLLLMIQK